MGRILEFLAVVVAVIGDSRCDRRLVRAAIVIDAAAIVIDSILGA